MTSCCKGVKIRVCDKNSISLRQICSKLQSGIETNYKLGSLKLFCVLKQLGYGVNFLNTRLLAIFYFNCKHVLFVTIVKQTTNKKFRGFYKKKFLWILRIIKNRVLLEANILKIRSSINFGPDRFSRFDVY